MGLQESRGKLTSGMKDLLALWNNTKTVWTDANAEKFEQSFFVPLEMDIRTAASAMDQMAVLLMSVRRECE